jgi:hypothetical protein
MRVSVLQPVSRRRARRSILRRRRATIIDLRGWRFKPALRA